MCVLVDRSIIALASGPKPSIKIETKFVQPSSVDLPIGGKIYQVASEPCLNLDQTTAQFIRGHTFNAFDLAKLRNKILTLTPGSTYLAEIAAEFNLPSTISGYANPKSSTGRNGLHTKLVGENPTKFDFIPMSYQGQVFVSVSPRVFPVQVRSGETLVQLRLVNGERTFVTGAILEHLHRQDPLISNDDLAPVFTGDGLMLHLDLSGNPSNLVAHKMGRPIPIWEKATLDPVDYFHQKGLYNGMLFLEPGQFALACTIERVRIPPTHCAEMMASHATHGEVRWHDAGFIDPGFGYDRFSPIGNTIVCEITNYGSSAVMLGHGQEIGTLRFEALEAVPDNLYGATAPGSHYGSQQGIRTSKNFKPWPFQQGLR